MQNQASGQAEDVEQLLKLHRDWYFSNYNINIPLMRTVFPIKGARDYTCGFRAYRASILQAAFARYGEGLISQKGFSCMVDILLKLRTLDPIMGEVPLILRYDLKHGMSKMHAARTTVDTLALMLRNLRGR